MASFFNSVEKSLLSSTENSFSPSSSSSHNIIAYTDGSCPNNHAVSYDNPAGWGFALVYDHPINSRPPASAPWQCSFGPLRSNPQSVEGLSVGSTNTGELRAIIELFDFLLCYSTLSHGDNIMVYTDSQYVLDLLHGSSIPSTHPQLVNLAQQYYTALSVQYTLTIAKVPGHKGFPGNEMADLLAKRGVTRFGTLGRFSATPSQPLRPPDIGHNQHLWLSQTVQQQSDFINTQFQQHSRLIPELPLSAKKPWISPDTLALISDFQSETFNDLAQLKAARKAIKKAARKDKKTLCF